MNIAKARQRARALRLLFPSSPPPPHINSLAVCTCDAPFPFVTTTPRVLYFKTSIHCKWTFYTRTKLNARYRFRFNSCGRLETTKRTVSVKRQGHSLRTDASSGSIRITSTPSPSHRCLGGTLLDDTCT